ncbi:MAG: ATP synthase F0 subunit B [Chloroflexi bacterium]|nr:ATP synthase F0 subunit B [Chloroflexota bacterium]
MDIQHLVDRLEELLTAGRHVPFTTTTLIDEQRALEIIDQMRISIPEEIEKAKRVLRERDRVIAQANEEAARIRELAREKSETLIQRDSITQAAQARAASIIEQSRREADQIRQDADQYVMDVLSDLEDALNRTLGVVRNGISHVQAEANARAPQQAQQHAAPSDIDTPSTLSEPAEIERISTRRG